MTIPANFSCHRAWIRIAVALAPLVAGSAFGAGSVSAVTATSAPQTHVLFMGADFSVEQNRKFYRVEDVTATALVIKPAGKPVPVPFGPRVNLLIEESLKLAATSVAINQLKFERAYSNGADPFDQLARSTALAAGNSAAADIARGELMRANLGVMGASGSSSEDRASAEANRVQAETALTRALDAPNSQVYDVAGQSVRATGEERFDAIRISFQVTPETDLAQAYVGVIAQIRERDSKRGPAYKSAYVQPLGPMSAGVPRKVLVYRGGLPAGYLLEGCEVHFYRGGEELATNLSRQRVELTDDEAFDYRIIEYIDANKGRTLPAVLATTTLPVEVRRLLSPVQLKENYQVRVGKNGRVVGVFRGAAGQEPLQDRAVESALKTLRFKPALEAGKPVESLVPVDPGKLASP